MIVFSGYSNRADNPAIDGEAQREVKLRIMGVLFSDEIPDPRDIVIICLGRMPVEFSGASSQVTSSKPLRLALSRCASWT